VRWQLKAAIQRVLSAVPRGAEVNYLLQRHVTHGLPASDWHFSRHAAEAVRHLDAYERHAGAPRPTGELDAFEFGAGWDLIGPLSLWALGVERQTLVDVYAHVRWELVNDTLARMHRRHDELAALAQRPLRRVDPEPLSDLAALERRFGIRYLAPCDARATRLPPASFDLITSTFTLEHIPAADVAAIARECARLLRPGGVLTGSVGLEDHYAFDDPRISVYNFLRFSERRWRLVNSSLHFQNRLRARDHLRLVRGAGLAVHEHDAVLPDRLRRSVLDALPLAEPYASAYTRDELAPTELFFAAGRAD
jgi:SAM-dependent methyltransferase